MFSFLTSSAHTRNSSQITRGTVIEAAEGFLELLFLSAKANSVPGGREGGWGEGTAISAETAERSKKKGRRWPVHVTQWKICLSEHGCS